MSKNFAKSENNKKEISLKDLGHMSRSEYCRKEPVIVTITTAAFAAQYFCPKRSRQGTRIGAAHCNQSRRTVEDIWICLGDYYFRRPYRMSYRSFWHLHPS